MTRIATLAANEHLLDLVARNQQRVNDLQTQIITGKRAQTYAGLDGDARQLLNLEGQRALLGQFTTDNDIMKVRLDSTVTAVEGVDDQLRGLQKDILDASASRINGTDLTPEAIADIQDAAFRTLRGVQDYLNTEVDGRYVFAGTQVQSRPVDFNYATLADFQSVYDGVQRVYPPTRDAHVGSSGSIPAAATGGLTFNNADPDAFGHTNSITATTPAVTDVFAALKAGMTVTVADGSGGSTTYTVTSVDHTNNKFYIDGPIQEPPGTDVGNPAITVTQTLTNGSDAAAQIDIGNWYKGDSVAMSYRASEDRSISLNLTAIDPAFEKAFRALGLLAEGDLASHPERLDQAAVLLNSALDRTPAGTLPFGSEQTGSLDQVKMTVGFQQVTIDDATKLQQQLSAQIDKQVDGLENVDISEAITRLLEGSNALDASYQTLSRVSQLSLTNYL